jgi:hypothetical protein
MVSSVRSALSAKGCAGKTVPSAIRRRTCVFSWL